MRITSLPFSHVSYRKVVSCNIIINFDTGRELVLIFLPNGHDEILFLVFIIFAEPQHGTLNLIGRLTDLWLAINILNANTAPYIE